MEILNKTEIININRIYVAFVIISVVCIVAGVLILAADIDFGGYLAIVGFITIVSLLIFCNFEGIPTGRYKYEVIIDESYPATELYKNYEVIEQRGKIWVIEDKESVK